jgi:AcrR family transcriptional regulator
MASRTNTRRKILDLGEALIQDNGYNGFSYAHIAAQLGVRNAAVHYHFRTKDDLVVAVLRSYRDRFRLWTNNARVKDLESVKKLDWFFGIYANYRAENGKVCLVGSLEAEYKTLPESVCAEVQALNSELLTWLEQVLEEGRHLGTFQFKGHSADKAAMVLSSLQGGLQIARALGSERFHAITRQHLTEIVA